MSKVDDVIGNSKQLCHFGFVPISVKVLLQGFNDCIIGPNPKEIFILLLGYFTVLPIFQHA